MEIKEWKKDLDPFNNFDLFDNILCAHINYII